VDVVSGQPVKRLVANPQKQKTFLQLLTRAAAKEHKGHKVPKEELRKVEMLADFLEKCTALDPAARLTPAEAIQHRFIQSVITTATQQNRKGKQAK
jgi:serine/threonine protein kinase